MFVFIYILYIHINCLNILIASINIDIIYYIMQHCLIYYTHQNQSFRERDVPINELYRHFENRFYTDYFRYLDSYNNMCIHNMWFFFIHFAKQNNT